MTAYLHIGTAMRIAFSLGLHRDVSLRNKDSLERERSRRLWWTVFVLDYEMASRFDYPCYVMENSVYMRVPPATEQVSDPLATSPPSILTVYRRYSTPAPTPPSATKPSWSA